MRRCLCTRSCPSQSRQAAKRHSNDISGRSYETWLTSRPRAAENDAIKLLLISAASSVCTSTSFTCHPRIAIPQIRQAKENQERISVETCPHYLTFAAEEIPDGATQFKCAPPIRENENREQLWAALGNGAIEMIATDHSPLPAFHEAAGIPAIFMAAWGGIASLQLSLPAIWTEARSRGYSLTHIAKWMCEGPARLAGLDQQKGTIAVGRDADLVVWNPEARFQVDPSKLHHRHKTDALRRTRTYGYSRDDIPAWNENL